MSKDLFLAPRAPGIQGLALLRRYPFAAILHFQADLTIKTADTNSSVGAFRVTVNIRKAFLNNSQNSRL